MYKRQSIYQSLSKMEELGAETEILATSGDVSGEQSAHWSPVQGDGVRENQLDEWAAQSFVVEDRQAERLLVFSDSRQDAAFFAPYFERTYNQILARSLIYRVISDYRGSIIGAAWRVSDLVLSLIHISRWCTAQSGRKWVDLLTEGSGNDLIKEVFWEEVNRRQGTVCR